MLYNSYVIYLEISKNEGDQRLDRYLRKYLSAAPLSLIYKIIRKDIKVNGSRKSEKYMLQEGDLVSIYMSQEDFDGYSAKPKRKRAKRQFGIAYEDENVLIVNKPYGLLTHGTREEKQNHLANQVLDYLIETGEYIPSKNKTFSIAPANRLDRNTTGLVAFGKTASALRELNRLIKETGVVEKYYLTILYGELKEPLKLKGGLLKDQERNKVAVIALEDEAEDRGRAAQAVKYAETWVTPILSENGYTFARVRILTGRTHQIRAQLAAAGYPLLGDVKYLAEGKASSAKRSSSAGKPAPRLNTQLLHAAELSFVFEGSGQDESSLCYLDGLKVKAEMPEDFQNVLSGIFGDKREEISNYLRG